jgi:hypothetical protein
MSSDSITFRRLENIHVVIPTKAQSHFLRCEARRSLQNFSMASFSLYIPTEVSPAYTSLPRTTVWHIQNWSRPLTRLGRVHTWLMVAHVRPGWSLQELILNMIQVTYPSRRQPVTPRYSLKLSVTLDTISKPVTQILTPCCYRKIIHLPPCAIVQLIKIKTKDNPNFQDNTKHDLPRDSFHN